MSDGGLSPHSPPGVHSVASLLLCDLAAWFSLRPRSFSETLTEFLSKNRRPGSVCWLGCGHNSSCLLVHWAHQTVLATWLVSRSLQPASHLGTVHPWGHSGKLPPCPPHCCCINSRPWRYLQEMAHQCWNHIYHLDSEMSYSGEASLFASIHPLQKEKIHFVFTSSIIH